MIPRVTWINEALHDPALFQATLLPSALHHAMFYGRELDESFDLFKVTTALVKQKLDDPELGISDNNIAAVICLSFFEVGAPMNEWSFDLDRLHLLRTFLGMLWSQMYTWKAYDAWWSLEAVF